MFRIINRALLKAVTGLSGVVALSLLMMTTSSCERIGEGEISVTLRQDEVSAAAGSIFMGVTASSDWTLTLEFADGAEPWASLNATSGSGSRNNVILTFEANNGEASRSLDVVLTSANQRASATFTQLAEGEQPTEDPDYPGLVSDAPRQWMELPEMTIESGCAWVFHNMTIDGKEMRNYSLYYDVENRLSHWVAYPLNAHLRGTGSRHDQFDAKDPKIPVTYQPYTERGWGVDGYDRDELVHGKITLRCAVECYDTGRAIFDGTLESNGRADGTPTLLMHGDADRICAVEGSRAMAGQNRDNSSFTYIEWKGYYHEIHNGGPSASGDRVIEAIRDYIKN